MIINMKVKYFSDTDTAQVEFTDHQKKQKKLVIRIYYLDKWQSVNIQ